MEKLTVYGEIQKFKILIVYGNWNVASYQNTVESVTYWLK